MNFRQRVAWLSLAIFVLASCLLVYYVFDVSEAWRTYAVEHVQQHHSPDGSDKLGVAVDGLHVQSALGSAAGSAGAVAAHGAGGNRREEAEQPLVPAGHAASLSHVADIPWWVVVVLCTCLYLQAFFAIFACTQPEPRLTLALSWPVRLRNFVRRLNGRAGTSDRRASNGGSKLANALAAGDCRLLGGDQPTPTAGPRSAVAVL